MTLSKILMLSAFIGAISLSGCANTFDGAGRDIQGAGEWIQDTF